MSDNPHNNGGSLLKFAHAGFPRYAVEIRARLDHERATRVQERFACNEAEFGAQHFRVFSPMRTTPTAGRIF
jgi:hypothetical protein